MGTCTIDFIQSKIAIYGKSLYYCMFYLLTGGGLFGIVLFFINSWLIAKLLCSGSLPYKHKIIVAGNHELSFDDKFLQRDCLVMGRFDANAIREYLHSKHLTKMKDVLVNCTYLEDFETTVFGLRVYGSPWYDDLCL